MDISDNLEKRLVEMSKTPHLFPNIILSNSESAYEDEYILFKEHNKFYIAKCCLGVYGWHHLFQYDNLVEAKKDFVDFINQDYDEAKEHAEINDLEFDYQIYEKED